MSRLMTSADSRLAAISKVVRVRVRVLEEQVEHALAAQQRHLLHLAVVDAEEGAGGVEDVRAGSSRGRPSIDSRWISSPLLVELRVASDEHRAAVSASISKLKRPCVVARERAATARRGSAIARRRRSRRCIGSSRPPRSTSTASVTLAGRPKSNSSLSTARMVRPV